MIVQRMIDKVDLKEAFNTFKHCFTMFDFDTYLEKIYQNAYTYVAKIEDEIVGIIIFYANDFDTKTAFITLIEVNQAYRKHHIGKALMGECFSISKSLGMQKINLEVAKDNEGAIVFYKKLHFGTIGENNDRYTMTRVC